MDDRKENSALVSIVMPAYNAAGTIRQAICSVMRQTYTRWELIIIDDSSTDSTEKVIKKTAAEFAVRRGSSSPADSKETGIPVNIRLLKNPRNLGVAASRNRGIREAKGEWIAFLDSDDMWRSDKLGRQMELAEQKKDADIIYTGSSFIQRNGDSSSWIMRVPESVSYQRLLKQNVVSCSSVFIRRELALRYPMIQRSSAYGEMHEDYPVWLQVLKDGGHAYGINEPLLIYRLSEGSRSGNKRKAALMTYHVYRYIGLGRIRAMYCFLWHAVRNAGKYFMLLSA